MKMHLMSLVALGLYFGTASQLCSQGVIVPNGVVFGGNGGAGIGYQIIVSQDATISDIAVMFLIPQSLDTFQFARTLDEGVRAFFVSSLEPVSEQAITANSYSELTSPNSYVFANGVPFYVGLYTGSSYPQNGIYLNPLFGWARLINNNGVINLLDSALEYGGGGIYAGTQIIIPVPEPSVFVLSALGSVFFGWRRWKA